MNYPLLTFAGIGLVIALRLALFLRGAAGVTFTQQLGVLLPDPDQEYTRLIGVVTP